MKFFHFSFRLKKCNERILNTFTTFVYFEKIGRKKMQLREDLPPPTWPSRSVRFLCTYEWVRVTLSSFCILSANGRKRKKFLRNCQENVLSRLCTFYRRAESMRLVQAGRSWGKKWKITTQIVCIAALAGVTHSPTVRNYYFLYVSLSPRRWPWATGWAMPWKGYVNGFGFRFKDFPSSLSFLFL